jgi:dipeptidyl aminopeptidase/acylaminoacyl peptidase
VTIVAEPADAAVSVNGQVRGPGPVVETFRFDFPSTVHRVAATRPGYKYEEVALTADSTVTQITLQLKPLRRRVTFTVRPVPGVIKVDGSPLSPNPVSQISVELEFTQDARGGWAAHAVEAERPGFRPARADVRWEDQTQTYVLNLEPPRKDRVVIHTDPPGADVYIGGKHRGIGPVTYDNLEFEVDPASDQVLPQTVRVEKRGYAPAETTIALDDGQTEYHVGLKPPGKQVRVQTVPPGAVVAVEGVGELPRADGVSGARLDFPPVDDAGTPKTYAATATLKTPGGEWEPAQFRIGWDEGQETYTVRLKDARTMTVWLLRAKATPAAAEERWSLEPQRVETIATRDVKEGAPGSASPVRVAAAPKGAVIDSLAVSPDGSHLLYTLLREEAGRLTSRLVLVPARGEGEGGGGGGNGERFLSDGASLDLTPSFTPDGGRVVFSSDRGAGTGVKVWSMRIGGRDAGRDDGGGGEAGQLTNDPGVALWPSVDSSPRPRLFYEALLDGRDAPRLFVKPLAAEAPVSVELPGAGGSQPRVGPKADLIVYAAVTDEATGRRDLMRIPDGGGPAVNLTNSPDSDEFDPAWSRNGRRIAFASDRGTAAGAAHPNHDVWFWDAAKPDEPTRVTTNESWDDQPCWDPTGRAVYFRSNRGGQWGVWRVVVR